MKKQNNIPQPVEIKSSKTTLFNDRENSVESHLTKQCKLFDIFCIKLLPSISGIPDRILIANGKVVFVELKAPGKKPRKLQKVIIKQMQDHGAIVYVIDTIAGVDSMINKEYNGVD